LIPFGDIHRFAKLCSEPQWFKFLDISKKIENALFLGMGDYDDFMSTSERKEMHMISLHDQTIRTIEETILTHTEQIATELSFMKGKLIGLIDGNHYAILQSGITTTQYLCQKLSSNYLGKGCAFIRLSFAYGKKRACLDLFIHHGKGSAKQVGSSLNPVEAMSYIADADIYLMGHDHKKINGTRSKIMLSGGNKSLDVVQKKIIMGRTGSFLRGYVDNEASYVAKALYTPSDLGALLIHLIPTRINSKQTGDIFYIDTKVTL
jgi:hypothetical protein